MGNYGEDSPTPWDRNSVKTVIISKGVTSIGVWAFCESGTLTSVTIPDSVTSIGDLAFAACSNLTDVNIPDSVTSIGRRAFYRCSSLTSVTISNSVTSIEDYAFSLCTGLTSVTIPNSVTIIKNGAFSDCSALTSVTIPNSVTTIKNGAFGYCSSLTDITIPNSVTSIEKNVFYGCSSLESITIPNRVTKIEESTFQNCSKLTSVTIPGSVKSIGDYAFDKCVSLTDVFYGGTEQQWREMRIGIWNDPLYNAAMHYYPFSDVDVYGRHKPFAEAIEWASDQGITTGYSDGTFRPNQGCTRAQVVTFLWRAAGSPEPTSTSNPFVDVKDNNGTNPFYKAILWAVEKGITTGTDATHFSPNNTCTRAQFVTFLWRFNEKPDVSGVDNPFVDVSTKQANGSANPFYEAILWAVQAGVTNGVDATHFSPNSTCTRAQVVTFIYRNMK